MEHAPAFHFDPQPLHPFLPIEQITPEWAWGGGTGRGVKVAVIDSGVDAEHPLLSGGVQGYIAIRESKEQPNAFEYDAAPHTDTYGHGTACAGIIRQFAPECEIYSVKVLTAAMFGRGSVFAAGLRWAIENDMDVCSLSLGTTKKDYFALLHELADRAYFRHIPLITAANNMPLESFPSVYASVISVASHDRPDPYCYFVNPKPPVEFSAFGINVPVAWANQSTITATGNSFAAPHITGLVTRIRSKHPHLGISHIKVILRALAQNVYQPD